MPMNHRVSASKYPSASRMVVDAAVAGAQEVKAIASHEPAISDDEVTRRLAICHDCPSFDPPPKRCKRCGCFTEIKARMRSQHCPDALW